MMKKKSHGRLSNWQAHISLTLIIALLGIAGVAGGIWLSRAQNAQLESTLNGNLQEQVNSQARLLVDSFWKSVELVRLRTLTQSHAETISWWAEYSLEEKELKGKLGPKMGRQLSGLELKNTAYLKDLGELEVSGISDNGVGIRTLISRTGKPQLGFAFLNGSHSILFAVMDSTEFFSVVTRVTPRKEEGILRAYLITAKGKILAHSEPAYVGSDFSHSEVTKERVASLFSNKKQDLTEARFFASIDKLDVLAGVARPGSLPLAVVVERARSNQSTLAISDLLTSAPERMAGLLGLILLGAFAIAGRLISQRSVASSDQTDFESDQEAEEIARQLETDSLPVVHVENGHKLEKAMLQLANSQSEYQKLSRELEHTKSALGSYRRELAHAAEFEREAVFLKAKDAVARALTRTTAKVVETPVLYFACHPKIRSAVLHSTAGFDAATEPTGIQFTISDQLLRKVYDGSKSGELVNIAEYEPLAQALVRHCGSAHYEAWAVTGYGYLGRTSGKLRFLGVLVVLQAGTETMARKDSITRMLRVAGLVYENALLSAK